MSKTIDWPSGETSSESQVPLVVVKSWERVALSGSVCGGGGAAPAAGAPCAASAEMESEEIAIRRAERDRRLSMGRKPLYMVVTAGMGLRRLEQRIRLIDAARKGAEGPGHEGRAAVPPKYLLYPEVIRPSSV